MRRRYSRRRVAVGLLVMFLAMTAALYFLTSTDAEPLEVCGPPPGYSEHLFYSDPSFGLKNHGRYDHLDCLNKGGLPCEDPPIESPPESPPLPPVPGVPYIPTLPPGVDVPPRPVPPMSSSYRPLFESWAFQPQVVIPKMNVCKVPEPHGLQVMSLGLFLLWMFTRRKIHEINIRRMRCL